MSCRSCLASGVKRLLGWRCIFSARKTTPIKLIKKNIERFISHYEYGVPEELYLCENQLNLFEDEITG